MVFDLKIAAGDLARSVRMTRLLNCRLSVELGICYTVLKSGKDRLSGV